LQTIKEDNSLIQKIEMPEDNKRTASPTMVIIAFGIVYLVWGSTYLFIRLAIQDIPALMMASMRFTTAGVLLLTWCALRKKALFVWETIRPALISGLLLLFFGNGAVVWGEQFLPSSLVAVLTAASPIWFVVLDRRNWRINFRSRETVIGLIAGFMGVILLFSERAGRAVGGPGAGTGSESQLVAMALLVVGAACWGGGSLYSKYNSKGPSQAVTTSWQMISAGIAFMLVSNISGEWKHFKWSQVSASSWFSLGYLITLGSLAGYTAFAWLLQVRTATQVSTHAYVNPVVAVLLGVLLLGEKLTPIQWVGLTIILGSVVLVNLARYRKQKQPVLQGPAQVAYKT
jgi:drug/metabolite transporter (DMT)-like permease